MDFVSGQQHIAKDIKDIYEFGHTQRATTVRVRARLLAASSVFHYLINDTFSAKVKRCDSTKTPCLCQASGSDHLLYILAFHFPLRENGPNCAIDEDYAFTLVTQFICANSIRTRAKACWL